MKKYTLTVGICIVLVLGVTLSVLFGSSKLQSSTLEAEPICYAQADIDAKNSETSSLE